MTIEAFDPSKAILNLIYLIAAVLFVVGLKMLSKPDTARAGNLWAGAGMLLSMITTLLLHKDSSGGLIQIQNAILIVLVIIIATITGWIIARKVRMTAMPQLVSFYNATGGAASGLIALIEFSNPVNPSMISTLIGLVIGNIAFSGSMIAYGKLDGKIKDWSPSVMKYINLFMLLITTGIVVILLFIDHNATSQILIYSLYFITLIYGIFFVMPIGGADMPVVISFLNSFTGIAAAMAGFIYQNQSMILGGILVGAAGTVLTVLMCRAMNRSLFNVLIGSFGGIENIGKKSEDKGILKEISLSDAGILLNYSTRIVIIPGYGLASAQAQHLCSELDNLLSGRGADIRYAIHPVAGRMPGHMNVLLAEANVPYEKLIELDDINPDMPNVDLAIVVGANDVVNPAALDDPKSPIYGMPIIHVHEAKNIIIIKRGMGKGYAAIENSLFYNPKTRMLFGNAKEVLQKLITELKNME